MEYIEFRIQVNKELNFEVIEDVLASELADVGFDSFTSEGNTFMAFIPRNEELEKSVAEELVVKFADSFEWIEHAAQNWNKTWEESFDPVELDDFAYVYAHFHEKKPGFAHYIKITPKMSFGTGHHSTTRLVMTLLKGVDCKDKEIIDIGTGTGILAILAHQLGARKLVGTEIETWALENAEENFLMNDIHEFTLINAVDQPGNYGAFDIVIANINRNTILGMKEELISNVKLGGDLFLSGFYERDMQILEPVFKENGFTLCDFKIENDWCAMHLKKN